MLVHLINLLNFKANSLKFNENYIIWILFTKQLKINKTRTSSMVKIIFWYKGTLRVSIKIKIDSNWYVVVIILIKNNLVLLMNLIEYEVNLLKFTENLTIWILLQKQSKISRARASLKMKIFFWFEIICRVSNKIKIVWIVFLVAIILIKTMLVHLMNWLKFEVNSLKFNENYIIWIQLQNN